MIMENTLKYSIVVPCYNSEIFLETLCEQVYEAFEKDFELILVNDFSSDETKKIIFELKDTYSFIKGFSFPKNLGQIAATVFGISKAEGKITITIDDDLQHSIQSFKILENLLSSENKDIIVATWKTDETLVRNISSTIFRILSSLIILKKTNFRNTAFRMFKGKYNKDISEYFCSRFWFDPRRIFQPHKVGQVYVDHFLQLNRPQSSFRSRMALALKHILLDSYLINLIITIFIFFDLRFVLIFFFYYLIQLAIRVQTKRKRIKIFNKATEI